MKKSYATYVPLLAIGIAVLGMFVPNAAAIYSKSPSGNYLNLQTNVVVLYDNSTSVMTTASVSAFPDQCPAPGSTTSRSQCGQCGYVPDGETTWESSVAQYTYGRCASVDVTNPLQPFIRADVRVVHQGTTDWFANAVVEYMRIGQQTPVVPPVTVFNLDCDDSGVSFCQSGPQDLGNLRTTAILLGADYYCVKSRIFDSRMPNSAPVVEAGGCTGILQ